ncbi:cation-translocating P-type ATPase [Paraliomyxa miuraensis]|uniref:cation-translocating P-type ATPase n=1 Tax=Paraliomyxa miuraensis TaxID=376150 RepID=UPI00225089C7|nr:cation-transporting P-type ATPase [Paraliomyxa miuraensis]MCX4246600.1 cation-transporting P-type ATPase [Paraliomyxa miuraensis]
MPADSPPVPTGLSIAEARARLERDGPNALPSKPPTGWAKVIGAQLANPLMAVLGASCVLSGVMGHVIDAVAIGVIVSINVVVGAVQEHRAERAVIALRSLTARRARVLRGGHRVTVPAAEVVVGDVLDLEAGDVVAADARLLQAHELSTVEANLTGESVPVEKDPAPVPDDAPLAERFDHVFMGTSVATGTGYAEVVATGRATQMGRIAGMLAEAEDDGSPLQRRLAQLGRTLVYACVALVGVVALVGLWRGMGGLEVLMGAVSLAVAAVPEGLPAVVTVALAGGVHRMSERGVLVRRLASVETLGCATVICTDKTGTLTTGVMTLRETWARGRSERASEADASSDEARSALLQAAVACSDAELHDGEGVGDPTEVAILRAAAEVGIHRAELEQQAPRVRVRPFETARRRMSILRADGVLYLKGAPEVVLPLCGEPAAGAHEAQLELAGRGLRVLAVATGQGEEERDLELLGLLGLADAPRPEAMAAVEAARRAGIRVVMITGDHAVTAEAIAREMGLLRDGVDPAAVVHARATAEDKTRIVHELRARGEVVAMTGDGVNDAPSIREADIGVAMGGAATELTREVSEMVLTHDDLSGMVDAISEGRRIYDNIRRAVIYLLGGNAAEILVMLGAVIAGMPLPLLPLHLLWINLVTEPLPGLALATDPATGDLLHRPPRPPSEPLLGRRQWRRIGVAAVLQSAATLAAFWWALQQYDVAVARTVAFTTLVFAILLRAPAVRRAGRPGVRMYPRLVGLVLVSAALQGLLVGVPVLRGVFQLGVPDAWHWGVALGLGFLPALAEALLIRGERSWDGTQEQDLRNGDPSPAIGSSSRSRDGE